MALRIHPREAWAYIKARRRQLRPKKFERRQTSASRNFLCRKQAESVFPLECGTIEAYLPEGYRSRKRDKLIRLLATEGFQRNFGLGHHFHEISKAELEPEKPAYAEDNDLLVEMAAFEKIINARHFGWLPPKARSQQICLASTVRTRGGGPTSRA